ncbi:MAG: COX15/CtaA family protein [Gemmatimonadota bacterium]|nr:COX15/CtaA family protein [Gemmatimonadota bacterium]
MLHARAFKVSVVWTLALLFLGSVVHATESSLACPDWPTCFGTMVPEMTGGVFWEHLHRLVAGGLVLMFGLATWLAKQETGTRPRIFRASLAGMGLLVVQSVFGGLTVIYRLPDMVSTTHLTLAFGFLALATVLAAATSRPDSALTPRAPAVGRSLRLYAGVAAGLVFGQSVVGALVRHTDGGMSCPDLPLCLGQVVPPLVNIQIISHFTHRVLAVVTTAAVLGVVWWAYRSDVPGRLRRWLVAAAALVVLQVGLGVASVLTILAVVPVSTHTLVAAMLLSVLVYVSTVAGESLERRPEAGRDLEAAGV